jgi:hypothetical protein
MLTKALPGPGLNAAIHLWDMRSTEKDLKILRTEQNVQHCRITGEC